MVATKTMIKGNWIIAANDNDEEDWGCPKCGGKLRSCCGNSHIWCYDCGYNLWEMFDTEVKICKNNIEVIELTGVTYKIEIELDGTLHQAQELFQRFNKTILCYAYGKACKSKLSKIEVIR